MDTEVEIYKQKLSQKNEEMEEFIYIISHDIKAPLRAISNLTVWIEDDLGNHLENEVKENMELLKNRVKRMEQMINALTDLSRVSRMHVETAEVNLNVLLHEIMEELAEAENIMTKIDEMPVLFTYRYKLHQVFSELIKNALFFNNKKEKAITLKVADEGNFYRFSVKDNGQGIPESAREKIFKIFYTANLKDEIETTGAGLHITKKVVEFVGGEIKLDDTSENGTTISFTWPKKIE